MALKTKCFRIGIGHIGVEKLNNTPSKEFRIVSCGWINPHKNIFGIFGALNALENTHWEHYGEGDDFLALKNLVNDTAKIEVELPGKISNKELLYRYSEMDYTCFLSLSTTEGLPVSMMEAMAFGIPVISTDVGGCSEIVNENTGVLLPKNYSDEDVRKAVKLCAEKFSSPEARKRIQEECKEKFDAKKNYGNLIDFLKSENDKHMKYLTNVN